jgi:glycosyltransferase involved in cell wall biosynthesis
MHSYLFSANWRTVLVGRLAGVPLVITSVRNVDIHGRPMFVAFERMLSHLNDRVVANAEAVKDHVAVIHGIRRDRISVILNGVSLERVAAAAGRSDGPPTVLVVASLTPKKDHHTLLDAAALVCARLPDTRFVLVGDGPLRGELERRSEELGVSRNVEFGGELTDIGPALRQADLCALTSLKEGCSNFILESMLAGRPVVATDAGGNRELVEDGETGYVVALGDAEAVASRMVEILSDRELATRMGESGRRRAERLFNVDRMVSETMTLYESTLRERVPGLVEWSIARGAREPGSGAPASGAQGDASAEHVSEAEVGG